MTAGTSQTVSVTATGGKGDTIKFASSNKAVLTVNKASAKASTKGIAKMGVKAVKEGTAKLTVSSKNTGVKKTFSIKVEAAAPAATQAPPVATTPAITTPSATPGVATTPAVTATAPAGTDAAPSQDPNVTKDPNETQDPNATKDPNATQNPDGTQDPNATKDPNATQNPDATKDPNATTNPDATEVPSVSTNPAVTASPSAVEFTAKQTGEKKITITNPTAMTKDDIVIKRGSSVLAIGTIQFNDDATTAVVTLAGSIVATNYTVTVGENTVTFTGQASEVANIQITSDVVAMDDKIGTAVNGFANYVVYNQFGENITSKTTLVSNASTGNITLDAAKGIMTITWDNAPRLNDMVSVVLMYQNTGVSVSKMLTVQAESAPAEVEVYGVYNADGKTLAATNVADDNFYYLFRVKDQYGNYMNSGVTIDTNLYLNVSSAMTNVELNKTLQTVTVDGVNYFGLAIKKVDANKAAVPGTVTALLIPGGSGKTVTSEITIAKGNTVTSLTISVPGSVPQGGTIDLNYVALDENGDDVTNYRVLKEVTSSDTDFKWVKEDGTVKLRYDDSKKNRNTGTTAGSSVTTVFTLPSYETKLVTVNVTDKAVPAAIVGIDKDTATATRVNATGTSTNKVSIPVDKLKFEDQYGNSVGSSKIAWANTSSLAANTYGIMLVEEDAANDIFDAVTPDAKYNTSGADNAKVYATSDGSTFENIELTANDDAQLGTESFTFKLVKYDGSKWVDYTNQYSSGAQVNYTQTGAFTTILTVTEDKRFSSYEVNTIDAIYDNNTTAIADYTPAVTVKGVLKDGSKVDLTEGTDFKVIPVSNLNVTSDNVLTVWDATANGNAGASTVSYDGDATTATGKYKVVINANGETIEKTVKIDQAAPTTATIKFDDGSQKGINLAATDLDVEHLVADLKAVDSYGVDATGIGNTGVITKKDGHEDQIKITATDIDTVNGTVTDNGTKDIAFSGFVAGDSFTVTFTAGDAKFSTVVSVQEATGGSQTETRTVSSYSISNSSDVAVTATGNASQNTTSSQDALALLPTSAYAKLSDGSYVAVTLAWDWSSGVNYDNSVETSYEATATVTGLPAGITPIALTANVTVSA